MPSSQHIKTGIKLNFMGYKNLLSAVLVVFLCFYQLTLLAQDKDDKERAIKGVVTTTGMAPLGGVQVLLQERNTVTATDSSGRFTILATPKDVLIFKKDGYLTVEKAADSVEMNVVMTKALTDAGEGDQVEIPFGTRKKREITAAITSFRAENLPQLPVSDVRNMLSGRIPGLYLEQNSSQPGNDGTDFRIRGLSSYGSADARALIDGVQRDFGDMDVTELENISVLKDAAALAWYGLRGGNGIVLITTKKGSSTSSGIRFDVQTGLQTPQNLIKPLNSYNFASLYNEALVNDGAAPIYDENTLNAYQSGQDPYRFPDNNYVGSYLKSASPVQRYVLSADGGNSAIRYFALLSYFNQGGLFDNTETADFNSNTGYKRFNFRGNVDFTINKYLTITLNAGGRSENRLSPGDGTTSVLSTLYNLPPNAFPILNENGTYGGNTQFNNNPLGQLRERGYNSALDRVLLASLNVKQKLDFWVEGLSANVLYSYDANGTYSSGLNKDYEVYDFSAATPAVSRNKVPLGYRNASFTNNNRRNEVWAGLDYDKNFNDKHTVNASFRGQRYVNASPERLDFRTQGLAGRIEYGFKRRYYLSVVAGYSGSENFPEGKRYGLFPAVSGGWIASDEAFLKNSRFINYLKLRASHGTAGNGDIGGTRFPFESYYSRNPGGGYVFGTGFSGTNSANEINVGNPNITWETVRTTNAGADIKLLSNSLSFSADFYKTRRSDILTEAVIPALLGQNIGQVNAGIVDSKGIEAALNYNRKIGQVALSLNGNILLSDDRVIAQNGQDGLPEYQKTTGYIAGSSLVFLSDGLFQSQEQISNSPVQTLAGRVVPGDIKYKDIGGPLGVPDGIVDNLDRVRINQRGLPNTYFGFGTGFQYKIFDLSVQFQGVAGRTISIQPVVYSGPFSLNHESFDRWTPATSSSAKYPRLAISDVGNNTTASDFWLRSADYIRLKFVELGVTVPPSFLNKYGIKSTRFYIGGFNLLTFDGLNMNVDPEILDAGRGSSYPFLKTYTVGLSTRF